MIEIGLYETKAVQNEESIGGGYPAERLRKGNRLHWVLVKEMVDDE
jgi:hypothetical protein